MSTSGVLVIADISDRMPVAASAELLGLARRLAAQGGGEVTTLAIGAGVETCRALIARGADRVLYAADATLADYDSESWTACAAAAAVKLQPRLVLAAHNSRGGDLAPRLAFRLDGAVATGCIAVMLDGEKVTVTRPCYGGNAREIIAIEACPAIVTMRSGCAGAPPAAEQRAGEITALEYVAPPRRTRVVDRQRESGGAVRLEDAKVVVAGGRGLDGAEGFEVLRQLASVLGGAVGASRVPCDLGWCAHSMQIGLTGKTVTPDLYVAVGISGAGHHLAGCAGAKNIVAINSDTDAPIFKHARFGVVADYRKVVPALIRAIGERKAAGAAQANP